MKQFFKRLSLCIPAALIIVASLFTGVSASSAAVFTVSSGSCSPGEQIEIVLSVDNVTNLGGLTGSITFNTDNFTFIDGSLKDYNGGMKDTLTYFVKKTKSVNFTWDSSSGIDASGNLFSVKFKAADNANGKYDFTLSITDCYSASKNLAAINSQAVSGEVTVTVSDAAVQAVIEKIDNIGTVEYTSESLEKIISAEEAYKALSSSQQRQVTNYGTLVDAKNTYYGFAADELNAAAAESFKNTHKDILSKTIDNVALTDETAVNNAQNDYSDLNSGTKALLTDEKTRLDNLAKRISDLKEIEAGRLKEEKLKQAVNELRQELIDKYPILFNTTVENISVESEENVESALLDAYSFYNDILEGNPYRTLMDGEIAHLEALQDKINELKGVELSDSVKAFNRNFSRLLKMDADSVTLDDEQDVVTAYNLILLMDEESQEQLAEAFAKLEKMLAKIEELKENQTDDEVPEKETEIVVVNGGTKTVYKAGSSMYQYQEDVTSLAGRSDTEKLLTGIKYILISTAVSALLFILAVTGYVLSNKQKRKAVNEDESD